MSQLLLSHIYVFFVAECSFDWIPFPLASAEFEFIKLISAIYYTWFYFTSI